MTGVEVDPELLTRFALFTNSVSGILDGTSVEGPFWSAQNAVAGSELPSLCGQASDALSAAFSGMAQRLEVVADTARGASNDYRVTESEFAARLRGMDGEG
ncbi:MAG: hypothetical protein WBQ44_00680 [Rhodococcus sp. (in: high G+C Gram-positive bacteria)]